MPSEDVYKSPWKKFNNWWLSMSPFKFVVFTNVLMIFLAMFITPVLLAVGVDMENEIGGPDFGDLSKYGIFFIAVVLAPLLETVVFQWLPIKFLKKYIDIRILITLSAIFFALAHSDYSYWYSLLVFPMGLVLAYAFYAYKHPKVSGFWITVFIHAFRNGLAMIPLLLLEEGLTKFIWF